jgi:hypothetical protein
VLAHTPKLSPARGGIWLLLAACGGSPDPAPAKSEPALQPAPPTVDAPAKAPAQAPAKAAAKLAEARDDVPLAPTKILGQPVADVQAQLGEHLTKGMMKNSCIRFVPERTFFTCKYALQRYKDKTGNFEALQIGYEDGKAVSVAYDGWKHATGPFTPEAMLAAVGLTLPEPGVESSPAPNVRLWSWFNNRARLVLGGKQYRVEVSVIDGEWARSRVEVILNDPLTSEQKAVIIPVGPKVSEPPAP